MEERGERDKPKTQCHEFKTCLSYIVSSRPIWTCITRACLEIFRRMEGERGGGGEGGEE